MSTPSRMGDWEENTERRIGILEQKMDKILDPERGLYPLISGMESRLKGYAVTILVSVLITIIVQIILYGAGHR